MADESRDPPTFEEMEALLDLARSNTSEPLDVDPINPKTPLAFVEDRPALDMRYLVRLGNPEGRSAAFLRWPAEAMEWIDVFLLVIDGRDPENAFVAIQPLAADGDPYACQ